MKEISMSIEDIEIGSFVEEYFEITEEMGAAYADVSKDYNPIHLNREYAEKTKFKGRIAHGMLIGGFISGVIGTKIPGLGAIYESQELKFQYPVRYGDIIKVEIKVLNKDIDKNRVVLQTRAFNQDNRIVIDGIAVVLPKRLKKA